MNIQVCRSAKELGDKSARFIASKLETIISEKGSARIVVSTGASQLLMIEALLSEKVEWNKIDMFHLDEYVALPATHPASFRKYLNDRLISKVNFNNVHLVDGTEEGITVLSAELRKAPIDIGIIGIGENSHIAFNDPPANFESRDTYTIVELDDSCKKQQVREGWFAAAEDVPKRAVTMTVYQIMQCVTIVSCVPYEVKAKAVSDMLHSASVTPMIPASILKTHGDFHLFLDKESAEQIERDKINALNGKSKFTLTGM